MADKIYLGDSVYAEFDRDLQGDVLLTTENGKPDDPSNAIYLEPQVAESLVLQLMAGSKPT